MLNCLCNKTQRQFVMSRFDLLVKLGLLLPDTPFRTAIIGFPSLAAGAVIMYGTYDMMKKDILWYVPNSTVINRTTERDIYAVVNSVDRSESQNPYIESDPNWRYDNISGWHESITIHNGSNLPITNVGVTTSYQKCRNFPKTLSDVIVPREYDCQFYMTNTEYTSEKLIIPAHSEITLDYWLGERPYDEWSHNYVYTFVKTYIGNYDVVDGDYLDYQKYEKEQKEKYD